MVLPGQLLVPELEGHLGARTSRPWRGEEGEQREGRAEGRRDSKALLGQLVLERI